jgi:hypothetical protein
MDSNMLLISCIYYYYYDILRAMDPRDFLDPEQIEWYLLSPAERWRQSCSLMNTFIAAGGDLGPEPDTQSPFFDYQEAIESFANGRPGVHLIRRG